MPDALWAWVVKPRVVRFRALCFRPLCFQPSDKDLEPTPLSHRVRNWRFATRWDLSLRIPSVLVPFFLFIVLDRFPSRFFPTELLRSTKTKEKSTPRCLPCLTSSSSGRPPSYIQVPPSFPFLTNPTPVKIRSKESRAFILYLHALWMHRITVSEAQKNLRSCR